MSKTAKVNWSDFRKLLRAASLFVSRDYCRMSLNSVMLKSENRRLRAVATNGCVLFIASIGCDGELPQTLVSLLDVKRILSLPMPKHCELGCRVSSGSKKASFVADGSVVTFKPVSVAFPNYEQAIPKPHKKPVCKVGLAFSILHDISKAAKIIGESEGILLEVGSGEFEPAVFTCWPAKKIEFKIIQMPMRLG